MLESSYFRLVISALAIRLLLLCFFLWTLLACSESKQEILARLSRTIAENEGPLEAVKTAREEIVRRIREENRRHSAQIAELTSKDLIKVSMNASSLIWTQAEYLYYFQDKEQGKLDLDLEGSLIDMNPSWDGNYLALLMHLEKEKKCRIKILSLKKKEFIKHDLGQIECDSTPAINDTGDIVFYANKGELYRFPIASPSEVISFSKGHFVTKYKKIKNRFVLYQVTPQAVLIFFGNAGHYNMYYYDGQKKDKLHKNKIAFSSARLYPSLNFKSNEALTSGVRTQEKERLGLYRAHAFVYSGGAGKRKLHALRFGEKLKVGEGFQAKIFSKLIFMQEQGQFLSVQKQSLYFWDPISARRQKLPLSVKNFFPFHNGLIYVGLLGQLYFRQKLFSDFEISLLDLYDEISSRELSLNAAF